jgi:FAD/FMN-containing dehydrogenase
MLRRTRARLTWRAAKTGFRMLDISNTAALAARFAAITGAEHVSDDPAKLQLHSEDIWARAKSPALLVVAPASTAELSAVIRLAGAEGLAIAPRGAGASYTSAYVPAGAATIALDMSRMNQVLSVDPVSMTVTVQGGCTWAALHAALKPLGVRTPFWGPMSGLVSTIGGGLSQLNAMFGAARYGTSSESVVGLAIVLANGELLRTGAGLPGEAPFYRHYGPDLAGLFCGDGGVFGIKAEITLRLMRIPAHEDYASFAFKTGRDLLLAMAELSRAGVASEICAFDPGLSQVRMKRASLAEDVGTLRKVVAKESSLFKGLQNAAKIAMAGRDIMEANDFSLHLIAEGRSAAAVSADIAQAKRIALAAHGREIENSIARLIRVTPFPPLNSILGPAGERWAPVHGIASLAAAPQVFDDVVAVFTEMADALKTAGVAAGYLYTSLSTNALIIEPVFYWPEERFSIHESLMEKQHLARLPCLAANPEATAVVTQTRSRVIDVFARHGCGFFQIGRSYPYRESRDPASMALLEGLKTLLDPEEKLNPGVLGLSGGGGAN